MGSILTKWTPSVSSIMEHSGIQCPDVMNEEEPHKSGVSKLFL